MTRTLLKSLAICLTIISGITGKCYAQNSVFKLNGEVLSPAVPGQAAQTRQLKLSWASVLGAEEYDLEWTVLDDESEWGSLVSDITAYVPGNNSESINNQLLEVFRNNSSRVTITNAYSYSLSLFNNTKYILVRIRQVAYNAEGVRLEGAWEYKKENGSYAFWETNWNEPLLNWQIATAYAEDGKRKEVVSYFDGSLRNRQTVTVSDTVAIVQENVYDEFGRLAASILPAPVKEMPKDAPVLHYFKNFNLNMETVPAPYSFKDLKGLCEVNPGALQGGASAYYSPSNQFLSNPLFANKNNFTKYIPNAVGYPLSVTQYTADNTGRVKIQGGVGAAFQPGQAESKTTKYYYSKPSQWELDRLFGNDVGLANHYLKNMVIDPNGQVSISYLNASGKTIATALAGSGPLTQEALSSNNPLSSQLVSLIRPEQFSYEASAMKLSAKSTHTVAVKGPAELIYNVERLQACNTEGTFNLCRECRYDLNIAVKNDCGESVFSLKEFISLSNPTPGNIAVSIPGELNIGEYYITMELSLSRKDMEEYAAEFITEGQNQGSVKTEYVFIKKYLDDLGLGSFGGCERCMEALGTRENFVFAFKQKLDEMQVKYTSISEIESYAASKFDALSTECQNLQATCNYISPCEKYVKQMEDDVSPGGQYALFDQNYNPLEPEFNALTDERWRIVFPVKTPGDPLYDATLIALDSENTTIPEGEEDISPSFDKISPYDANFTMAMRVKYWNPDWAPLLLQFHPEYCKLQFCQEYSNLFTWDKLVQDTLATHNGTKSISKDPNILYDRSTPSWLLSYDPFFKENAPGFGYYNNIKADLEQYSSRVLKNSILATKSLPELVDYMLYCGDGTEGSWNTCAPVENCRIKDKEWIQYRDFYFELKERYIKKYRDEVYCANRSTLCQIGTPTTLPLPGQVQVTDFSIRSAEEGETECSEGLKGIVVTYLPGNLRKAQEVELYYPGINSPLIVKFTIGESFRVVCIPVSVDPKNVKVADVTIANP